MAENRENHVSPRQRRVVWALCAGLANPLLFLGLFFVAQSIVDTSEPEVPPWLPAAWAVISFPGRYLLLLPRLAHPFGLGSNDDLNLLHVAAVNGFVWAVTTYLALTWSSRRRLRLDVNPDP